MKLNEVIERLGELGYPAVAIASDGEEIVGIAVALSPALLRVVLSKPELWEIWEKR